MKRQRNYDKKVKLTRILLTDYLVLKAICQQAGISMAEALHRLIEHQAQLPLLDMAAKPTYRLKAPVAFLVRPQPIIVTNGHKAGILVIKPKGGVIQ